MPLTSAEVKAAKPSSKTRRLWDQRGLYLEITPSGGRYWRWKYRFTGKEKRLALGVYPTVSLADARRCADEARLRLANGDDPATLKRHSALAETAATHTFEVIGLEWFERHIALKSDGHRVRVERQLKHDLFPWIGGKCLDQIDPPMILACLHRIEARGAINSARRVRSIASQVFRYGIAKGVVATDPARDLGPALMQPTEKHHASLTEPQRLRELLRAINAFQGTFVVQCALRLAPMLFVRPGELRQARWADIDLEQAQWRLTTSKNGPELIVPLARQAVRILEDLHPLTCSGQWVFPSLRTSQRPMSENSLNAALRRLGFGQDEVTAHGFRATARTLLDEELGYRIDWIEHQLGHSVRDPNGRAYNRTKYLQQRTAMMQQWADYLDNLRS